MLEAVERQHGLVPALATGLPVSYIIFFSGRKCRTPAKNQEYGSFCITYHILHLPIGPFRPQPQSPTATAMVTEKPHGRSHNRMSPEGAFPLCPCGFQFGLRS